MLVYTEFVSFGIQRAVVRRFLPLAAHERRWPQAGGGHADVGGGGFEFEPSAPRRCSPRCCPATSRPACSRRLLEGAASEHASRQRAMKAATDNADEIISPLLAAS